MTNDSTQTCAWKSTPFATPFVKNNRQYPGFPDEWTIQCVNTGTLRTTPLSEWVLCPYCGKTIVWVTQPGS